MGTRRDTDGGMGTQGHRKEGIFKTRMGTEGPERDTGMGTQRDTDGGMGTQPEPEVAPWRDGGIFRSRMGTEGLKRDRKGCRDGDTERRKDGDMKGHGWGNGDTGTQEGLR